MSGVVGVDWDLICCPDMQVICQKDSTTGSTNCNVTKTTECADVCPATHAQGGLMAKDFAWDASKCNPQLCDVPNAGQYVCSMDTTVA